MTKALLLLSAVFFFSVGALPQRANDSRFHTIAQQREDTIFAASLLQTASRYNNTQPDSSLYYANLYLNLSSAAQTPSLTTQAWLVKGYTFYIKGDYPAALSAYQTMYTNAAKASDSKNMSVAVNNQGNVYIELNQLNKATDKYKESLAIATASGNNYGIARSYNNIGYVYKETGVYDKAIENFLYALTYYEKLSLLSEASICYNNIAIVYVRQKNFEKALEYNRLALSIQQKNNLLLGWGISLQSIANIYGETGDYANAIAHYKQASVIYDRMNDTRQKAILYSNMGELYHLQKRYDSSILYYAKAIAVNKEIGNRRNLTIAYIGNASSLISQNRMEEAKGMLDSAEVLSGDNSRREDLKSFLQVKSDYYMAAGNPATALLWYKKYTAQKDSLLNEQNVKTVADLNIRYETEKKKLEIELLNKNNSIQDLQIKSQRLALTKRAYELAQQQLALSNANLLIANNHLRIQNQQGVILKNRLDSAEAARRFNNLKQLSSIQQLELQNQKLLNERKTTIITLLIVFTLLAGLLGYSYYKRYQLKQEARRQADVLHQQELASKAILDAEEQERQRIARDLHDGVGQMMSAARMNLSAVEEDSLLLPPHGQNGLQTVLSLIDASLKEVRAVSHSMMPNALLKRGLAGAVREFIEQVDKRKLAIRLHTEGLNERIDQTVESMLYRIVQECINNVIKHAKATQLDISLTRNGSGIEGMIEDNGQGFLLADIDKKDGIGFKNIRSRIEFLKGNIEWSSAPQQGTLIAFRVPAAMIAER